MLGRLARLRGVAARLAACSLACTPSIARASSRHPAPARPRPPLPCAPCAPQVTPQAILDGGLEPPEPMRELYAVLDKVRALLHRLRQPLSRVTFLCLEHRWRLRPAAATSPVPELGIPCDPLPQHSTAHPL